LKFVQLWSERSLQWCWRRSGSSPAQPCPTWALPVVLAGVGLGGAAVHLVVQPLDVQHVVVWALPVPDCLCWGRGGCGMVCRRQGGAGAGG
jgi:hypothetical protein